eukprot:1183192-Prorocentrum_minimum.AAC.4
MSVAVCCRRSSLTSPPLNVLAARKGVRPKARPLDRSAPNQSRPLRAHCKHKPNRTRQHQRQHQRIFSLPFWAAVPVPMLSSGSTPGYPEDPQGTLMKRTGRWRIQVFKAHPSRRSVKRA